jgi:hypothetical protein
MVARHRTSSRQGRSWGRRRRAGFGLFRPQHVQSKRRNLATFAVSPRPRPDCSTRARGDQEIPNREPRCEKPGNPSFLLGIRKDHLETSNKLKIYVARDGLHHNVAVIAQYSRWPNLESSRDCSYSGWGTHFRDACARRQRLRQTPRRTTVLVRALPVAARRRCRSIWLSGYSALDQPAPSVAQQTAHRGFAVGAALDSSDQSWFKPAVRLRPPAGHWH